MLTEAEIFTALRDCYDPALPCNIVDLGLIRAVKITADSDAPGAGMPGVPSKHIVHIDLVLTSPEENAEAQLCAQITNRLAGMETVSRTIVNVLEAPAWSPSDITPAGRRILGLDGNPNLVQIR